MHISNGIAGTTGIAGATSTIGIAGTTGTTRGFSPSASGWRDGRDKGRAGQRRGEKDKRSATEELVAELIDRSARYLVIYEGAVLATFANEDDALLFEAELADLDRAHGTQSATCEVLDRRGRRAGGYLITAGHLCTFLRDTQPGRYGRRRRR